MFFFGVCDKLSFFSFLCANNATFFLPYTYLLFSHTYFDYNKGLLVKPLYLLRSNLSVTNRDVPKIQFVKIIPDSTPTNPKYKKWLITTTLALTNQVGKMRGKKEALEKGHTEIEGDGILDYSSVDIQEKRSPW